ncbi:cytochrome P450 [Aspergillus homomorphus CBS 101889]|uniref:Benzoate 4-monooxygenase cytochrome P450 n=1 Tax=Aspergillus homomorphus (strain CBS 101889) TaxID=1450537 RepID=A0A395I4J0_ASPHC|nr:benzoate 4-monooxygenase cytochrome P450 [Aspergillus homomorphus CBS 101889]RAL14685.1 benzoate 4-monooxygenase cytochrome P450 [Aspergillus homomorphus CBS 101889]
MITGSAVLWLVVAIILARAIYRTFLHPLSHYPGPKLAAISNLPYVTWWLSGNLHLRLRELHDKYGEVVRIRPDALTYSCPQAWQDIYGHRRQGDPVFIRDPEYHSSASQGAAAHMINAQETDHARQKRLLSHAFSERSLREQESLITSHIDLFIQRLGAYADTGTKANIKEWLNFLTFDIIGDLAFGEPFGCLKSSECHPWVSMIFKSIKTGAFLRTLSVYPALAFVIRKLMPASLVRQRVQHYQLGKETLNKRLRQKTDRPDFVTYILRYNDERGMRLPEIEANATLIIQAGSETTATALSASIFYLQKHPAWWEKTVHEVREEFTASDEIGFLTTSKLPCLNAVLEESIRLFPPAPSINPRLVPEGGGVINGSFVPGGVSVSVPHYATYRSARNFAFPDCFLPERWLGAAQYSEDRREAFQPFSFGPKACIGRNLAYAEMRTVLAKLLWHFDLTMDEKCSRWDESRTYVVWDKPDLWLRLRRANKDGKSPSS